MTNTPPAQPVSVEDALEEACKLLRFRSCCCALDVLPLLKTSFAALKPDAVAEITEAMIDEGAGELSMHDGDIYNGCEFGQPYDGRTIVTAIYAAMLAARNQRP